MTTRDTPATAEFTGGCLCGAVRYRAWSPPLRGVICHCAICRRHSGAPALAFVHFAAGSFEWTTAPPAWYRSSRFAQRGFCPHCGSTLGMREDVLADRVQVCIGSLDDPSRVRIVDTRMDAFARAVVRRARRPAAVRRKQQRGAQPRTGRMTSTIGRAAR